MSSRGIEKKRETVVENAIVARELVKRFGEVEALKGVSLEVKRGEIYGVIGADGAGKTTLIRILTSLMLSDSGEAWLEGLNVVDDYKQIRQNIGYMPGRFSLYQDLSVEENLSFFATVFNTTIKENYHLIESIYVQIEPFKKRLARDLSGGMKQKLALCCALIHRPTTLFLDEPSTGVDPVSRKELWEMLRKLRQQDITILVSTPYMDEAGMCDRIALMDQGEFLDVNTPQMIIEQYQGVLWSIKGDSMYRLLIDLREHDQVESCFTFGETHHITVSPTLTKESLKTYLEQRGHTAVEIDFVEPSVEDRYMQLAEKKRKR